jgi:triosephosphate isomerase
MKRNWIIANWKMFGSREHCRHVVPVLEAALRPQVGLVLCPPAPYLGELAALTRDSELHYGAQDAAEVAEGARTGEWSAPMLADLGCRFAIVGHSERRQRYGETDALVARKAQACVQSGVIPVVCIGETEAERLAGQTEALLQRQLAPLLDALGSAEFILAYEPVWAIGTGRAATPELAQQVHGVVRRHLAEQDPALAARTPLLYGGSVKPDNATALFAMPDIDGGLIGGASLQAESLLAIYQALP